MSKLVAAAAAVLALAAPAPAIGSGSDAAITQRSIAGIQLGMTRDQVVATLGKPGASSVGSYDNPGQPEDWTRLEFPKRKMAVYFRHGATGAVLVGTWNAAHRTAAGVGPCSPVAGAKRAYPTTMKPSRWNMQGGKTYAYVLGTSLVLAADGPSTTVTSVALFNGRAPGAHAKGGTLPYAGFIAISERNCG
jgi:hypothetical protein